MFSDTKPLLFFLHCLTRTLILFAIIMIVLYSTPCRVYAEDLPETYSCTLILDIPWGTAPNQMGIRNSPDGARFGPNSFDTDGHGRMYILDTVNSAVKVYSRDGRLFQHFPVDIKAEMGFLDVDNHGDIWISDPENRIVLQFSPDSIMKKRIIYNSGWYNLIEPYIHVHDNTVQLAISRIDSVGIITPSGEMGEPVIQGKRAAIPKHRQPMFTGMVSGNQYYSRTDPEKPPEMDILKAGRVIGTIKFNDIDALHSVTFLGEDSYGNIYIRLTSLMRNITHIRKYDRTLRQLATIYFLPFEGRYKLDDVADIRINEAGDIYCLCWKETGMHMLKWSPGALRTQ